MKSHEYYKGKEQTYLKHFFLEKYLEKVAYKVLSFQNDFVYVDGFSGPWKSDDERYEDTSFIIAINQLRKVREGVKKLGKNPRLRCLFIEKKPIAYRELKQAINSITDIEVESMHESFEDSIEDIIRFIGNSFSLIFIDPTGWVGFGLERVQPLLRLRGEVLINFMFDYVNRFFDDSRPEIAASFNPIFGGEGWLKEVQKEMESGISREEAILNVYQNRARMKGNIPFITSTRIMKPLADRSYFYLVYGTRSWNGILTFREIEKKVVGEQERLRIIAKADHRVQRTRQNELFHPLEFIQSNTSFDHDRDMRLKAAEEDLRRLLNKHKRIKFRDVIGEILQRPLVWKNDIDQMLIDMKKKNEITIEGMKPRERTLKPESIIVTLTG